MAVPKYRPKTRAKPSNAVPPARAAAPRIKLAVTGGARRRDDVVAEIRHLIREFELGPGDRLLSERELAKRFGVSRNSVREAIQFLATIGLLEVRHGGGSYLRVNLGETGRLRTGWRAWVVRNRGLVLETLEVRMGAETFAAELAARRAGPHNLEQMVRALQTMKAARDASDPAAFVRGDVAFHAALCEAAGNETLRKFLGALGEELIPERAAVCDLQGRLERSMAEHFAIYEAVRIRDERRAGEATRRHLESVRGDILTSVIGSGDLEPRSAADLAAGKPDPALPGNAKRRVE